MNKFFNSIRFRVWILFIGFVSLIMVFLYINQVLLLPTFYNLIKTQESIQSANLIKSNWSDNIANDPNMQEIVNTLASENGMSIEIGVKDSVTGSLTFYTKDPSGSYSLPGTIMLVNDLLTKLTNSDSDTITEYYKSNNRTVMSLATYVGKSKTDSVLGYIIIHNYIEPLDNTTDILERQFFWNTTVVLCFAFLVSAFVVVKISNPIINMSIAAKSIVSGDFNMETGRGDFTEIKLLANNLNKASSEIAKTENLRKDLIANVSHDLKTPLTMIKAYAEMIRDLSGNNPEKREKHLEVIINEADRLNALVLDMLDLSKIQSGNITTQLEVFNFSVHLNDFLERFTIIGEEGEVNYSFASEITENIYIKADIGKIEQVVYNLISNAINYTGEDGLVMPRLIRKKGNICRFEVTDTGRGIDKSELGLIWERYYKANKSEFHKRSAVSTGLGLSIVKGILESHGFAYGVNSTVGKGSTFWFEAPINEPPAPKPDNNVGILKDV